MHRAHFHFRHLGALVASVGIVVAAAGAGPALLGQTAIKPRELPEAVLHNPDMGWVIYENYPLDQEPNGSSTLLTVPDEDFAGVDSVAIMFSWQDIEREPDKYDFSKADFAYDYWARRGKAIQLRVSATSLLWWAGRTPPAGKGPPDYVLAKLTAQQKQSRELEGHPYDVVDARNPYYRERLTKFLRALADHFGDDRPVTLIDLRGFGVWGEWHSGFQFPSLAARREALKTVIDTWTHALPNRRLAISASYDPDSPKELYAGPTDKFAEEFTAKYQEFLEYSAFDYALAKPNVSFRRDGCGGAVHSNERKLMESAFRLGRGPLFSEFVDGFSQSKAGGPQWVAHKIDDALSLHPNYIGVLGWQGADALAFIRERRDLFEAGLRRMGYRLVPTQIAYPARRSGSTPLPLKMEWINRGVGRALRDYEFRVSLIDGEGRIAANFTGGLLDTRQWVAGRSYSATANVRFNDVRPGSYTLAIGLRDAKSQRDIALPLADGVADGTYRVGPYEVETDRRAATDAVE